MKKFTVEVYRRKSAFGEWKRSKDLVIMARNKDSAENKLDKIGRKMCNDYCSINSGSLKEVTE